MGEELRLDTPVGDEADADSSAADDDPGSQEESEQDTSTGETGDQAGEPWSKDVQAAVTKMRQKDREEVREATDARIKAQTEAEMLKREVEGLKAPKPKPKAETDSDLKLPEGVDEEAAVKHASALFRRTQEYKDLVAQAQRTQQANAALAASRPGVFLDEDEFDAEVLKAITPALKKEIEAHGITDGRAIQFMARNLAHPIIAKQLKAAKQADAKAAEAKRKKLAAVQGIESGPGAGDAVKSLNQMSQEEADAAYAALGQE